MAVLASMALSSSTYTVLPVVLSRFCTCTSSARVTASVLVKAVIPMPIWAGRLGIARTTLGVPSAARMVSIRTPAMMLKINCWGCTKPRNCSNKAGESCGFTARIRRSAPGTHSAGWPHTVPSSWAARVGTRAGERASSRKSSREVMWARTKLRA